MHALRDEQNGEFMRTLREFREHDHATLMRFVNYLSTPDEIPAQAHTFRTQNKYFGAMVPMATLARFACWRPARPKVTVRKHVWTTMPLRGESVDDYRASPPRADFPRYRETQRVCRSTVA